MNFGMFVQVNIHRCTKCSARLCKVLPVAHHWLMTKGGPLWFRVRNTVRLSGLSASFCQPSSGAVVFACMSRTVHQDHDERTSAHGHRAYSLYCAHGLAARRTGFWEAFQRRRVRRRLVLHTRLVGRPRPSPLSRRAGPSLSPPLSPPARLPCPLPHSLPPLGSMVSPMTLLDLPS